MIAVHFRVCIAKLMDVQAGEYKVASCVQPNNSFKGEILCKWHVFQFRSITLHEGKYMGVQWYLTD